MHPEHGGKGDRGAIPFAGAFARQDCVKNVENPGLKATPGAPTSLRSATPSTIDLFISKRESTNAKETAALRVEMRRAIDSGRGGNVGSRALEGEFY